MDVIKELEEKETRPEALKRAEKLIYEGSHEAGLQIITDFEERENLSQNEKLYCQLLKCEIFFQQASCQKVLELSKEIYEESSKLGMKLLSFDALFYRVKTFHWLGHSRDDVFEAIKQGEKILSGLETKTSKEYIQRKARILFLKGEYYYSIFTGEHFKIALDCYEDSLSLHKIFNNKRDIIYTLIIYARTLAITIGELDRALNLTKEALKYAKEINSKYFIAQAFANLMVIHNLRGDFNNSIIYGEKSYRILEEINNKPLASRILTQIGTRYGQKGEYKLALKYLERSLEFQDKLQRPMAKSITLYNITEVAINMGNIDLAQVYLKQFKQLKQVNKSRWVDTGYRSCKALVLKNSLRAIDHAKAKKIYKELINETGDDLGSIDNFLYLSDLLLSELESTNNLKVMDEIEFYIARILHIAELANSFWLLGETYFLQAELKLLSLNLKEAQESLTLAQDLAEKYNLTLLTEKVSRKQDDLTMQTEKWLALNDYKNETFILANLTPLKEQINYMLKKRRMLNL